MSTSLDDLASLPFPDDEGERARYLSELRAAYETEVRAKYTQSEIDEMGKKGEAFGPDDDGHYSYPIGDAEDLKKAIKAVGRGAADHDKIRKYIIGRAKALGESDAIPDNWNADGSLKETDALDPGEHRHANFTGTHTHSHSAMGSQGGDATHEHEHTHDGDRNHDHHSHTETNARPNRNLEWRKHKATEMAGRTTEYRTFRFERCELRSNDDGALHLSGYASVTESPYDMGWYTEAIKRGAFGKTLAEHPDVQLLINHEGLPLARTLSGTLQLSEDNTGLKVDADLDPEDPDVKRLAPKMARGDIDQMSFAFRAVRQDWNEDYSNREITECDIHRGDVSVVNQGANPATSVAIRSADAVAALQRVGPERIIDALTEWRDYTLVKVEERVGKTLSSSTMDVLTQLLNLCSIADDAMDEAQPLLADLMGVPNPDDPDAFSNEPDDDDDSGGATESGDGQRAYMPLSRAYAARSRVATMRRSS